MATLDSPSTELFAAVFHALSSADPRSVTISGALAGFIEQLSDHEAKQLPAAIGGILPLLLSDPDRLRFAANALVRFDMFEAADALTGLAVDVDDYELLLSAAALAGNPGVDPALRKRLSQVFRDDRCGQIRLCDSPAPTGAEEMLLYEQRWPGARSASGNPRLAPVAVLDKTLTACTLLRLAVRLVDAGAVVRQLGGGNLFPNWFGPQTVVICRPQTRSRILSKQPGFAERQIIVDPRLENEKDYALLLRQVDSALQGRSHLRIATSESDHSILWDPEVYTLGAYRTGEVAFLASASKSSLYNFVKRGLLQPRRIGETVWAFSDVVAVRTWQYLKATQPKERIKTDIIPILAQFAGDRDAVRIGATSFGDVLVDRGDGWADLQTGNLVLDLPITEVDDTFRPFELGKRKAPHLLHTSKHTELHPAIIHGAPHLKDSRITARALAQLHIRGGEKSILSAYPELKDMEIRDTISIGQQLIAA